MNKINWELKIDGVMGKDYDLDEIDYICEKIGEGQFSGEINVDLEPVLPDGLQKYIDGVGLNILYSNYHKSTNGIWSRAEVVDQGTFEPNFGIETEKEYWEVGVSYGKADDCGSEDYYDKIYVWKVSGSGLQVVTEDYKPVDFAWRYNLQEKV